MRPRACSHAAVGRVWLRAGADDQLVRPPSISRPPPLQPHANFFSSFIKDGKIVPVEVTVSLLSKAIFSSPSWNFLVDGFPRNMDNFNGWFDAIGDECDVRLSSSSAALHRAQRRVPAGPLCTAFHLPSKRHGAAAEAQVCRRLTPPLPLCIPARARCSSRARYRVNAVGAQVRNERTR